MKIIIAGAGDIGKSLVNILAAKGNEVTLIESDKDRAERSAEITDALVLQGEPTDMKILKDAGIEKADAVVSLTKDDKSNLMISEIAKSMDIGTIIARVSDPENEELFSKLGVSLIVPIVRMALTKIENLLFKEKYTILTELGKGEIQIIEVPVVETSKLIGKEKIKDATITTAYRNGEYIFPDEKFIITQGDVLVLILKCENVPAVLKKLSE